jgi:Fe-S-cluster containining protein
MQALLERLLEHERAQSDAYREAARGRSSPCLAGCHGCCYRLVLVDVGDALSIAHLLLEEGRATPELRDALATDAARAEAVSPDDYFASGGGCVFLDRARPAGACTIYSRRPHDCRSWFIHGVPDGSGCAPGAPEPSAENLQRPDLEEADLRFRTRWRALLPAALASRPVWVPLALGVLAALDVLEHGPGALEPWRARLDAATARSFALVDD